MFPIKNIREYVTNKLDEITVLKKFRELSGIIEISETADDADSDRKPCKDKVLLDKVEVKSIPIGNTWIFENEFSQRSMKVSSLINDQKGAFTSEGKKVEHSLSTLSIFISAHSEFPTFEDAVIYPVGICCYNYYEDPQPNYNRDPRRTAGCVRKKYSNGNRIIPIMIEPIGLNKMKSPIFFFENPNPTVTTSFSLDLETQVIQKMAHL